MYSSSLSVVNSLTKKYGIPELRKTFEKYIDKELSSSDICEKPGHFCYEFMNNILTLGNINDVENLIKDISVHFDTIDYYDAVALSYSILSFNTADYNITFKSRDQKQFLKLADSSRQVIYVLKVTKNNKEYFFCISVKRYCTKIPDNLKSSSVLAEYLNTTFNDRIINSIHDPKIVGRAKVVASFVNYCRGKV